MGPNWWMYKINRDDIEQKSFATKWAQTFQNMLQIVKCWEWEYQREGHEKVKVLISSNFIIFKIIKHSL